MKYHPFDYRGYQGGTFLANTGILEKDNLKKIENNFDLSLSILKVCKIDLLFFQEIKLSF